MEHLVFISPQFQALLFYRHGGAEHLEHPHPLESRKALEEKLAQGCSCCSAFLGLSASSMQTHTWMHKFGFTAWLLLALTARAEHVAIAMCQYGLYLKPDFLYLVVKTVIRPAAGELWIHITHSCGNMGVSLWEHFPEFQREWSGSRPFLEGSKP